MKEKLSEEKINAWLKIVDMEFLKDGEINDGYKVYVDEFDEEHSTDIECHIKFIDYDTGIIIDGYKEYSYGRWVETIWDEDSWRYC